MIAAATPIATLVEDSLFLLDHARIVGKAIPPDVILPILQTRDSVAAGTLSAADETAFRVAFAELVAFMQPVTLESLSPESEAAADKERASYFRKMTWL